MWVSSREAYMPVFACFSYSADLALSVTNRNAAQRALSGPRRMPVTCFSYSPDAPLGIRNRDPAQPGTGDLESPPAGQPDFVETACFSYPVVPCFRY